MTALDMHDFEILRMLQANARERMEDIAAQTGLSIATVQRRIKVLKAEGVIANETAVIQPDLVGFGMTFLVMVELERERLSELDAFRAQVAAEPLVQQCYYVTGDFDFVLVILTRNVDEFKHMTHRLFFDNSNIKRFRTSLVMDRAKVSLTVPIEYSAEAPGPRDASTDAALSTEAQASHGS